MMNIEAMGMLQSLFRVGLETAAMISLRSLPNRLAPVFFMRRMEYHDAHLLMVPLASALPV
jgi:hypothetical protein